MEKKEILEIAILLALAAVLVYRKFRKNNTAQNKGTGFSKGLGSGSSAEKDDYEPYSNPDHSK